MSPLSPALSPTDVSGQFPQFDETELSNLVEHFNKIDLDADGKIDVAELVKLCKRTASDEPINYDEVMAAYRENSQGSSSSINSNSGMVSLDDFLRVVCRLRRYSSRNSSISGQGKNITRIAGATGWSQHSIDEDEKEQFVLHINQVIMNDVHIGDRAPIDPRSNQLFTECRDGLVLSKLINDSAPDTIDERVLNVGKKLNPFQMTENNNVVINSAKAVGCSVVNIGSQDLIEGREHLVLGLVWQIIKIGLLAKISLQFHPELYRLLMPGEDLEDLLKLPADALLIRWFNYHLRAAKWHREVSNFSGDIKDSENYTVLLNQLFPSECSRAALDEPDLTKRAEAVLVNSAKVGCRKYLTAKAICAGNPKLNLAYVAHLFNLHPGLAPLTEEEMAALDESLFNSQGDRESRAFALWMNSLGVNPFVNNLFEDLRDGRILLQVYEKVKTGSVNPKRVNNIKLPLSRFKCIENTNYAVEIGKSCRFSLVGIQGADITDGNKTLTLSLVWQLMRQHIIETLKVLSKDGKEVKDSDMVEWANSVVSASGKESKMSSFKDPSLRNGLFFLDLLAGMKKGIVNYELVTEGESDDDAKLNAKYAINVARKLGATIFLLPEDIIEVKPKMILTFVGSLMAIHRGMAPPMSPRP